MTRVTEADLAAVPEHLREGLLGYLNDHEETGGFLTHLLANDLCATLQTADSVSIFRIREILYAVMAHAHPAAWGSDEAVKRWLAWCKHCLGSGLHPETPWTQHCPHCGGTGGCKG